MYFTSRAQIPDLRPGVEFDQALSDGQDGRLRAVVHLQFMKDVANVVFDGLLAEVEIIGNFFIGLAVRDETQHGNFSFGQIVFHPSCLFPFFLRQQKKTQLGFCWPPRDG